MLSKKEIIRKLKKLMTKLKNRLRIYLKGLEGCRSKLDRKWKEVLINMETTMRSKLDYKKSGSSWKKKSKITKSS